MAGMTDSLAERYARFLKRQGDDWCAQFSTVCRQRQRAVQNLNNRGIVTIADLLSRFSSLSSRLKHSALDLIAILKIRQAIPVLLAALPDPAVRLTCADLLGQLGSAKATRLFLKIGARELDSTSPDPTWLRATILALGYANDQRATELLVSIFERPDLPGPIRGDAGDKLGVCQFDRRTSLYRRCRDAALRGLSEDSIEVQFWSMYVIGSLCNVSGSRRSVDKRLRSALPRLRHFAGHDHRLAPGFWWPISAEAEDVIGCIEHGIWPDPDAAERWQGKSVHGKLVGS